MTLSHERQSAKNYKWRLNPVWRMMLYSCTHMATVDVKGLTAFHVICQLLCRERWYYSVIVVHVVTSSPGVVDERPTTRANRSDQAATCRPTCCAYWELKAVDQRYTLNTRRLSSEYHLLPGFSTTYSASWQTLPHVRRVIVIIIVITMAFAPSLATK